jgi:hypothetical protein
MTELRLTAPRFVELAHQIVWCTVATVDPEGRPRSRILHPIWEWDGVGLVGWIATTPTPLKLAHVSHSPFASCTYWRPEHDHAIAECRIEWANDDNTRAEVWDRFKHGPAPVGYDPGAMGIPEWSAPTAPGFVVLRLDPWRLRVFPGSVLMGKGGEVLTWQAPA